MTGKTFTPSTTAASAAFAAGRIGLGIPFSRAWIAMGRNRAHSAVQPEFAHEKKTAQVADAQSALCAENANCDRQIEARAFFLQIGRRQVDGDVRRMVMCVGGIR